MTDELKTIKFQLMLSPSEAEAIDDWGFKNRIRTRAEAIRRLCQIGIEAHRFAEKFIPSAGEAFDLNNEYSDKLATLDDADARRDLLANLSQDLHPDMVMLVSDAFHLSAVTQELGNGSSIEEALEATKRTRALMDEERDKVRKAAVQTKHDFYNK